ncbi:hypothetical protein LINPERPRIM_LOCUS12018, partial [Linum perenne]
MAPFNFNSETHFITSIDGTTLQVNELTYPTIHTSSIRNTHWNRVATINPSAVDQGYDGLQFVNGRIEGREALTMLAQHLARSHMFVNPEGYCFHDVTEHEMFGDCEIQYLQLNDLFCWSLHGIKSVDSMPARGGQRNRSLSRYVMVRRNKYEELQRKVKSQYEEMDSMRDDAEELGEARDEIKKLRKMLLEKNCEIRSLVEKHGDEVEKLKEEKDEAIAAMRRLKDDITKEADKRKNEESEFQRMIEEKDYEIRTLRRTRIEEEAKARITEAELKEKKKQLEEKSRPILPWTKLMQQQSFNGERSIRGNDVEVRRLKDDMMKEADKRKNEESELQSTVEEKEHEFRMYKARRNAERRMRMLCEEGTT